MPNFKKRNSFSPLKERERRFIESNRSSQCININMVNSLSIGNMSASSRNNGIPATRTNWKELSFKARSSFQLADTDELVLNKLLTQKPANDYKNKYYDEKTVSPINQHSPGKKSIFGMGGFKRVSVEESKLIESQNHLSIENSKEEDLEVNSLHDHKDSEEDSVLLQEDAKSRHSDGDLGIGGSQERVFELLNCEK